MKDSEGWNFREILGKSSNRSIGLKAFPKEVHFSLEKKISMGGQCMGRKSVWMGAGRGDKLIFIPPTPATQSQTIPRYMALSFDTEWPKSRKKGHQNKSMGRK